MLKKLLKQSVLYKYYSKYKLKQEIPRWTGLDQSQLEFYSDFIRPGDLCFDIGANFGNRVKVFLKLGARVVAIEPQRECIRFLKKSFSANPNFFGEQKACGAEPGKLPIYISNVSTLSSFSAEWIKAVKKSGRFLNYDWRKKYLVEMVTLEQLIHQFGKPHFIKIDVEGYELEVLRGLKQRVPCISLEFVAEYLNSAINAIKYLNTLGTIKLNAVLGNEKNLLRHRWLSAGEMIDWLSNLERTSQVNGDLYVRYVS